MDKYIFLFVYNLFIVWHVYFFHNLYIYVYLYSSLHSLFIAMIIIIFRYHYYYITDISTLVIVIRI